MKIICSECNWYGTQKNLLSAPNPFEKDEMIYACPRCKEINRSLLACDEPECWKPVTCGTPTKDGYRNTCGKHQPEKSEQEQDMISNEKNRVFSDQGKPPFLRDDLKS